MIDVIAKYDNIMKFIHLPVQSGNDEILRLMGRRYSREQYLDLVRKIKEKIPNASITTDIIVGFPNESEEAFENTLSLCEIVKYDSAFTFIYSPRVGTPAAKMEDNIPTSYRRQVLESVDLLLDYKILKSLYLFSRLYASITKKYLKNILPSSIFTITLCRQYNILLLYLCIFPFTFL